MKKIILFLISLVIIVYGFSEFFGDQIIKQVVEKNISNSLDRNTEIGDFKINYLKGEVIAKDIKLNNKDFSEDLLKIENVDSLKQEIRVWTAKDKDLNLESVNKILFNNQNKEKSVGYITSIYVLESRIIKGLAMIKRKYLDKGNPFFSDNFGQISLEKSVGSTFL